jgi:hypothetical protein
MNARDWVEAHGSDALKAACSGDVIGWQLRYREERATREHGAEFRVATEFDNRFEPAERPSPFALECARAHGGEVATVYETVQLDPYSHIENGIGEVVLFRPPWLVASAGGRAAVFAKVSALQQHATTPGAS